MPEERKGMVKNPGAQKHIKTEIALCGDSSGWLDTVVLFKYMVDTVIQGTWFIT